MSEMTQLSLRKPMPGDRSLCSGQQDGRQNKVPASPIDTFEALEGQELPGWGQSCPRGCCPGLRRPRDDRVLTCHQAWSPTWHLPPGKSSRCAETSLSQGITLGGLDPIPAFLAGVLTWVCGFVCVRAHVCERETEEVNSLHCQGQELRGKPGVFCPQASCHRHRTLRWPCPDHCAPAAPAAGASQT